ncbi:hypothetical protein PPL_03536 [Heterostelium album PN500]|uniref:tRNA:m(4)X modification enzyme TRM13 n=1 Tax=Heterostelium pallidum (strain ATCC 26659 / Pp 5 / PN500) TaxID=670386 RepID=D3B526_HETP5|nr:hypothetical protein PPL_03536 [Heterostelium album PN500]EFA83494.1 hypothetical protein PPL_03536 [Heterostelium album PN500]|eukprot:XP_020435611.1 hypothetical protein PPL_03536 [Heterostelium album PN500]
MSEDISLTKSSDIYEINMSEDISLTKSSDIYEINNNENDNDNNNKNTNDLKDKKKEKREKKRKERVKIDHSIPLKEKPTDEDLAQHNGCQFWMVVKSKHRAYFCPIPKTKNSMFCTHHRPLEECEDESDPLKKRVRCPLNPAHIVYEHKLKKHLKGCPNSKDTQSNAHISSSKKQVYYNENINGMPPSFNVKPLSHVSTAHLHAIANKLDSLFTELFPFGIKIAEYQHSSFDKIVASNVNSERKLKHIQQESSIITLLENEQLLGKDNIYLEFGAGTGKLGYHVFQALENKSGHIMIDRMKFKSLKRSDRQIKNEAGCKYFDRFLIDIRHLDLAKVEQLEQSKFVIISKHLCGCATDLTLKCLSNALHNNTKLQPNFNGIGIATCCHHLCTLDTYINPSFISDRCKLTADEFQLMCSITSWATINEKQQQHQQSSQDKDKDENVNNKRMKLENDSKESDSEDEDDNKKLKEEQDGINNKVINDLVNYDSVFEILRKEDLGYKAKRILDYGRYLYLKDTLSLQPTMQVYTSHSKENMFLSTTSSFTTNI